MMNTKKLFASLTLAGIAMAAQSAFALPVITASSAGSANFGAGSVGYENGMIAPNPDSTKNLEQVDIGGNSFTTTNKTFDFSKTGQFNTWCIDIYHWMGNGAVNYYVDTAADLATSLSALRSGSGTTRVNQLIELANEVYSTVNTEIESAAFQLAVWEIAYGTADSSGHYVVDTKDSGFRVDSNTLNSSYGKLANTWLNNLGVSANTGNYKLTYLNDGGQEYRQDMIVFTPGGTHVPEPATLALLGLGLFGLGMARRKTR